MKLCFFFFFFSKLKKITYTHTTISFDEYEEGPTQTTFSLINKERTTQTKMIVIGKKKFVVTFYCWHQEILQFNRDYSSSIYQFDNIEK